MWRAVESCSNKYYFTTVGGGAAGVRQAGVTSNSAHMSTPARDTGVGSVLGLGALASSIMATVDAEAVI